MARLSINDIQPLANAWRAADLDPVIADRIDVALQQLEAARSDYRQARQAVETTDDRERVDLAYVRAKRRAHSALDADLRAIGDDLITVHLQPALSDLVQRVEELAPLVDGINDDSDAIAATPEKREAWVELGALVNRRSELRSARRCVSSVLPKPPPRAPLPPHAESFLNPEVRPLGLAKLHPNQALVAIVQSGAHPAWRTAAELVEAYGTGERKPTTVLRHSQPLDVA